MRKSTKGLLALITALCLLPALPAKASEDGLSLEWRSRGRESAELRIMGLEEHVYAVQLELTLDGTCKDLEFVPELEDVYTPECRTEVQGAKTSAFIYLVGQTALNAGDRLTLGTLEASGTLPEPEEALLTLLDRDLKPIRDAGGTPVELWGRVPGEGDTDLRGFRVQLEQPDHGTLRASPVWAEEDETVTLTVRPDTGYALDRLEVTQAGGRRLSLKDLGGNRFSFSMPDGQVLVSAFLIPGSEAAPALPFTDISPEDWFYEAAGYVYARGMMLGTTDVTFSPHVTTNRGMIVTILHRLEGAPAALSQGGFTDVPADMYCAAAVDWAAAHGIVGGYGNGKFGPRDTITRQQLAAILYRYAAFKGYSTAVRENPALYPDSSAISSYAWDAMGWAAGNVLLLEDEAGMLQPQAGATRAQAAFALAGLCLDIAGEQEP